MGPHKHTVGTINYTHFLPVSGHRPIKVPKDLSFQPPSGLWSRLKCSSGHLMSYCSDASADKPVLFFSHQIQASGQHITQTSASGLQRHHIWDEVSSHVIVQGQSTLCFVGLIAEPKVISCSETTLQQLFHD